LSKKLRVLSIIAASTLVAGVAVAPTAQAATKQKQAPKVSPSIYRANIKMDRDKDGTVCEK
jgi:uncharacterized lipoprotein YajG